MGNSLGFDLPPSALMEWRPPPAVHVQPFTKGLILLWLRPDTEDVAVWILNLHLIRPVVVGGRMPNVGSLSLVLVEERLYVAHSNPNPCSWISLISLDQEDPAAIARDRGHDA